MMEGERREQRDSRASALFIRACRNQGITLTIGDSDPPRRRRRGRWPKTHPGNDGLSCKSRIFCVSTSGVVANVAPFGISHASVGQKL